MDSRTPPPPYEANSLMLSSATTEVSALLIAAVLPPEYSTRVLHSINCEVAQAEHIPSCSGTGQRVTVQIHSIATNRSHSALTSPSQ